MMSRVDNVLTLTSDTALMMNHFNIGRLSDFRPGNYFTTITTTTFMSTNERRIQMNCGPTRTTRSEKVMVFVYMFV